MNEIELFELIENNAKIVGRVIGSSTDVHYSGSVLSSGSFSNVRGHSTTHSTTLDTGSGEVLVLFNKSVGLRLVIGDEVWAVGEPLSPTRFRAKLLFVPREQSYLDLVSSSNYTLHILVTAIGLFIAGSSLMSGQGFLSGAYWAGMMIQWAGMLFGTTCLCLYRVRGSRASELRMLNVRIWEHVSTLFRREERLEV